MVFFPLDEQLKLWGKHWSEGVAKQAIWLSRIVDFEKAEGILQEIGQMAISDRSVWRRAQEWGERFGAMEAAERARANALPGKWEAPYREVRQARRMGVAMDGSKIHIREEGWKEHFYDSHQLAGDAGRGVADRERDGGKCCKAVQGTLYGAWNALEPLRCGQRL